jgi:uncharacterized protein with FMN-binding domain
MLKRGSLGAKLMATAALVVASGGYIVWQPASVPLRRIVKIRHLVRPRPVAAPEPPMASAPPIPAAPPRSAEKTRLAALQSEPKAPPAPAPVDSGPATGEATSPFSPSLADLNGTRPPPPEPPPPPLPPPEPIRKGEYADGDFTGDPAECFWGTVQVMVRLKNGAIADVKTLQMPDHRPRSAEKSDWAAPQLVQEAIQEQTADIDLVTSATITSMTFGTALANALAKAKK